MSSVEMSYSTLNAYDEAYLGTTSCRRVCWSHATHPSGRRPHSRFRLHSFGPGSNCFREGTSNRALMSTAGLARPCRPSIASFPGPILWVPYICFLVSHRKSLAFSDSDPETLSERSGICNLKARGESGRSQNRPPGKISRREFLRSESGARRTTKFEYHIIRVMLY